MFGPERSLRCSSPILEHAPKKIHFFRLVKKKSKLTSFDLIHDSSSYKANTGTSSSASSTFTNASSSHTSSSITLTNPTPTPRKRSNDIDHKPLLDGNTPYDVQRHYYQSRDEKKKSTSSSASKKGKSDNAKVVFILFLRHGLIYLCRISCSS